MIIIGMWLVFKFVCFLGGRWLFTRLDPGSLAWILFVIRGTLAIFVSSGRLVRLLVPNHLWGFEISS